MSIPDRQRFPGKFFQDAVDRFLYTSVDDLQSTLKCSADNRHLRHQLPLLLAAREQAAGRGHKTRVQILNRFIRLAKKESP